MQRTVLNSHWIEVSDCMTFNSFSDIRTACIDSEDRCDLNSQKPAKRRARAGAGLNVACSFRDARQDLDVQMLIEVRLDLRGRRGGEECCFPGGLH